jgi:hypothetical protein
MRVLYVAPYAIQRIHFIGRTPSSGTLTNNHENTMQTKNDTSKHKDSPQQEAGEGCSEASCSRSSESPPTPYPSGAWSRSDYVREYDKLERELNRYKDREKHCATMDQAEKLALIYAIQEIGDVVCLSGLSSSPAQIVAAVKNLHANETSSATGGAQPASKP